MALALALATSLSIAMDIVEVVSEGTRAIMARPDT